MLTQIIIKSWIKKKGQFKAECSDYHVFEEDSWLVEEACPTPLCADSNGDSSPPHTPQKEREMGERENERERERKKKVRGSARGIKRLSIRWKQL